MINTEQRRPNGRRHTGARNLAATTVVLATLAGCSWVPDYANPVEWYRGTRDWLIHAEPEVAARQPQSKPQPAMPGADKAFPKISSVPGRTSPPSAAERRRTAGALIADRDRARYTDKIDRRQSASAAPRAPQTPGTTARSVTRPPAPSVFTPSALDRAAPPRTAPPSSAPPRFAASSPAPDRKTGRALNVPPQAAFGAPPTDIGLFGTPAPSRAASRSASRAGPVFADPRSAFGGTKVATILFNSGSSRLSRKGRRLVRSSLRAHQSQGGVIHVVGHASSRTKNLPAVRHQMANLNVSIDRANVVVRELVKLGARPENILVDALSDSQPLFFEVMSAGESGNRRVEIHLRR